jgi:hypothetical protein
MRKRFFIILDNSSQQVPQKYLCPILSINNTCKNFDKAQRRYSQDFTMFAPRTHNGITWLSMFFLPFFVLSSVQTLLGPPRDLTDAQRLMPSKHIIHNHPTIQRCITCPSIIQAIQDTRHDNIRIY